MPHNRLSLIRILGLSAIWTFLSLAAVAQMPEAPETWIGEWESRDCESFPEPWIGVTGQLLWLSRTEADGDQDLVVASTATTNTAVIRMDDLNLPVEAGFRGSILLGPPSGRYIELAYAGIFDQEAVASVNIDPAATGVTQMTQQFFGSAIVSLTNFQYTSIYESEFHSAELNVWSDLEAWRFRPFLGLRWIGQSDELHLFETSTPGNGGVAEFSNDMFGGQVGFATVLWQRADWFHVQAICKAGVYRNDMDLRSSLNNGGVPIAVLNQGFDATSCSGEVNITATWQLARHLNFHIGYTGLWLSEVGLVGDQNDNFDILAGTGSVDLGGVSYQGGHLGVTLTW